MIGFTAAQNPAPLRLAASSSNQPGRTEDYPLNSKQRCIIARRLFSDILGCSMRTRTGTSLLHWCMTPCRYESNQRIHVIPASCLASILLLPVCMTCFLLQYVNLWLRITCPSTLRHTQPPNRPGLSSRTMRVALIIAYVLCATRSLIPKYMTRTGSQINCLLKYTPARLRQADSSRW